MACIARCSHVGQQKAKQLEGRGRRCDILGMQPVMDDTVPGRRMIEQPPRACAGYPSGNQATQATSPIKEKAGRDAD